MKSRTHILLTANDALQHAYEKHGDLQWGRHEFYAMLKEEVDGLWEVIKSDGPTEHLISEMADIIAIVMRYYETGNRYGDDL